MIEQKIVELTGGETVLCRFFALYRRIALVFLYNVIILLCKQLKISAEWKIYNEKNSLYKCVCKT